MRRSTHCAATVSSSRTRRRPTTKASPPKDVGPVEAGQPVNAEWDSKVRALVAANVGGVPYTATSPGPFAGKERSHVPQLTIQPDGVAVIIVNHVMEPGPVSADAGVDAGDAGARSDGGRDGGDAGDASVAARHFVTTIFAKNDKGHVVFLKELKATDPAPPFVAFKIPAGTTTLRACEHCNLHGVWVSADAKV